MGRQIRQENHDVIVIGGGSAGVGAAIGAAKNGTSTLLVDAGPMVGGELISGIGLLGCLSTRGEWIVGGVTRELIDECERLGGFVATGYDYHSLHFVFFDPEIMKIAVTNLLRKCGVKLLLYTFAEDVVMKDGEITGVIVLNKAGRTLLTARTFIDCSGDGDIAASAGAPWEIGDAASGQLQPASLIFRMVGVETEPLLRFVKDHPENFALNNFPEAGMTNEQCAQALYRQGLPKAALMAKGPLLGGAIARGEMFKTSLMAIVPVSMPRKEVSLNTTRIGNLDALETGTLSDTLPDFMEQIHISAAFLRKYVPGFENAHFSGVAPRIGIRETRRIMGEYVLTGEDVMNGRKRDDGIAKGGHELDIHGAGTAHQRISIKNGGTYDIPYASLIPRNVKNLLVAGRCLSSTREAQSSARVMGTCLAMGQAAGTAAAMRTTDNAGFADVRDVPVVRLRNLLASQGAILDGTL